MIPHNRVITTREDRGMVDRVIASGQLSQGPETEALEHELCEFTGRRHAIAVSSGTEAIRLALMAFSGRRATVPGYSCVALANAAMAARRGKMPIAADVLPGQWTIDPDEVGHDLELDVVVAVNTFGVGSDVVGLKAAGAKVIEDCTHGFGEHVSDVEVLSFHATKLLGGAGGGVILTGDDRIARFVRDMRDYDDKAPGPLPSTIRLNGKMTDVHAALVRSKLRRLPLLIEERAELAMLYSYELDGVLGVVRPDVADRTWYRFTIEVDDAEFYLRRLEQLGIQAQRPVTNWLEQSSPAIPEESAPNSYRAYRGIVSLPCYPGLSKEEVMHIARCVREVASEFRAAA
jgi:UDP-2-acetamido-2-deoxy-ribo-hexuluronate aminotransferase